MEQIIQNAIELPDGTILISRSVHDYIEKDWYYVDGGNDYIRYGCPVNCEDKIKLLDLYDDSSLSELKEKLVWGTYGISNNLEHNSLKWVKLINCTTNHLENILTVQKSRLKTDKINLYINVIESILNDRQMIERNKKIKIIIKNL